jgi:uncharacterized protein
MLTLLCQAVNRELTNKLAALQEQLRFFRKVAVAFSGGVDSTLLLRVACDTLGLENVTALHAVSCLISEQDQVKAKNRVTGTDGTGCSYKAIKIQPLNWPEFVINSEQRCYICKKNTYTFLQSKIILTGYTLADGTNHDDLQAYRPGLRAIRELSVATPLAHAKLNKNEIRCLARKLKLSVWNQPSNSCLATRIPVHQKITMPLLEHIAKAEYFLQDKGFTECRVRIGDQTQGMETLSLLIPCKHDIRGLKSKSSWTGQDQPVMVQLAKRDLQRFMDNSTHFGFTKYLAGLGFSKIFLDIKERY